MAVKWVGDRQAVQAQRLLRSACRPDHAHKHRRPHETVVLPERVVL